MIEDPRTLNKPTFAPKDKDTPLNKEKEHGGVVPIENLTKKAPVIQFKGIEGVINKLDKNAKIHESIKQ